MSKNDKADIIKEHAINGRFREIEEAYGTKAAMKGREYALLKCQALKGKIDAGEDVSLQKTATDFMMFAVKSGGADSMESLQDAFTLRQRSQAEATPTQVADDSTQPQQDDEIITPIQEEAEKPTSSPQITKANADDDVLPETAVVSVKKTGFQIPATQQGVRAVDRSSNVALEELIVPIKKRPFQASNSISISSKKKDSHIQKESKKRGSSIKQTKKGDASKSIKDFPNAPKKPLNAYMYFGEENRKALLLEDSSMKPTQIMKELGRRWKELSDEEKAPFEQKSRLEKDDYFVQMEDYLEAFPEEAEEYHNFLRRKKNSRKSKTIKEKRGKVRKATSDDNTDDGSDDGEGASDLDSEGDEGRATKNAREPVDECGDLSSDKESDDHRDSGDFDSPKREKKHRFSSSSSTKRKLLASKVPQSKRLKGKVTPRSQSSSQRYKVTPSPSTKPRVEYIDPVLEASKTAKIVSALKGIKAADLPISEDIKRTPTMPKEKASFPADFIPTVGDKITLVVEAYREFVSELTTGLFNDEDLQLIQEPCSIKDAVVLATITAARSVVGRSDAEDKDLDGSKIITFKLRGETYSVLFVPYSSPLLRTEVFLLDRAVYSKSIKAAWLTPNAQVRRLFAAANGVGGEWIEGSIYHVRSNYKEDPFSSISVVWMELERNPRRWFYSYDQLDNLNSPWDLQLSMFVLPENVRSTPLPKALSGGHASAASVLSHLKTFDFSSVFMYNLTANEEYCEMFPDKVDRLDLHVISNRNKERHYDGAGGLLSLFNDLERMCENGKAFNSSNQGFQPWTLVDMMEKTIENLKTTLAGGIQSSTLGSSASDRASSRNAISLTAEMNEESATDDPYEEEERIATQLEVASQLEEV